LLAIACICINANSKAPKYIFVMYGDGMGINHVKLAENYKAYLQGLNYGGPGINFTNFPVLGLSDTQSLASYIITSPAAATSIFCGVKTNLDAEGVDGDGKPFESIYTILHKKGYKVGIMSTDPINHASPAALYSHTPSRGNYREITRQLPASGFEFFAGYSFIDFLDMENGLDADDYLAGFGYPTYYGVKEFNDRDKSASKAILVHDKCRVRKSSITAEIDLNKQYTLEDDKGEVPPVQMLDCCLDMFGDKRPFIIFCEEGNIDHASHLNFPMAVVNEVRKLEASVERALEFYESHKKETLIIVISDHETGGLALGKKIGEWIDWKTLEEQWNSPKPKDSYKVGECRELSEKCGVVWASKTHTGAPTPVFAIGNGAEKFAGCYDNTEIGKKILELFK